MTLAAGRRRRPMRRCSTPRARAASGHSYARGHPPDLSDAPPAKIERGAPSERIGDPGPMGQILVRGEPGHDIIPAFYPIAGEPVIDKPGKGAFCDTELGDVCGNAASTIFWSAASLPKSASTPRCARRTIAAIAASCYPTAALPIFPNSTR